MPFWYVLPMKLCVENRMFLSLPFDIVIMSKFELSPFKVQHSFSKKVSPPAGHHWGPLSFLALLPPIKFICIFFQRRKQTATQPNFIAIFTSLLTVIHPTTDLGIPFPGQHLIFFSRKFIFGHGFSVIFHLILYSCCFISLTYCSSCLQFICHQCFSNSPPICCYFLTFSLSVLIHSGNHPCNPKNYGIPSFLHLATISFGQKVWFRGQISICKIRLYEVKGMHLSFIYPIFFGLTELAKRFFTIVASCKNNYFDNESQYQNNTCEGRVCRIFYFLVADDLK